jgi:glucokinase
VHHLLTNLSPKFLGIEIGGTKIQVVCGDANGEFLSAHHFAVNKEEGAIGIRNNLETVLKKYAKEKIAAVGVGFGGPVNRVTGTTETSFHIEGWSGFGLKDWLQSVTGAPVFIDNDANVAALGEAVHGAGKDYRQVLYVTLGSGVGGGLIIDKKIFHGDLPGEIEIGHLQMDRNGTTLQDLCSGWAVDEMIRKAAKKNRGSVLAQLAKGQPSSEAKMLNEALAANDPQAIRIFEETTDNFAFGLSHAIHLLHPQIVVLGGGLSFLGTVLEEAIAKKLPPYLMKTFAPGPPIRLSQLKEKAVPTGALVLCSQNLLN